jgi:5-methylcytosine-specific restriction protein A
VWKRQAQTRREDPKRRALDALYRSRAWRTYSINYRANHPLCVQCGAEGRVVVATVVDHIVPTAQGGDFWAGTNHQSLCDAHHRAKSAAEVFRAV